MIFKKLPPKLEGSWDELKEESLWPEEFLSSLVKGSGWFFKIKSTQVRIRIKFIWRDMWIGGYLEDSKEREDTKLYICLIPTLPIIVQWWPIRRSNES